MLDLKNVPVDAAGLWAIVFLSQEMGSSFL